MHVPLGLKSVMIPVEQRFLDEQYRILDSLRLCSTARVNIGKKERILPSQIVKSWKKNRFEWESSLHRIT